LHLILAASTQQRLGVAVVALLIVGWLAYVFTHLNRSPVPPGAEVELSPNRKPYLDDDAMEGPRLNSALLAALVMLAVVAIGLPAYWLDEPSRQAGAEKGFDSRAVKRGRSLSLSTESPEHGAHFGCEDCHGGKLAGGVAGDYALTLPDGSIKIVDWEAPGLDTIMARFSPDEVERIITYGRPNTPMPAWGIEGGGPMNAQQVTDLVAYIKSIQLKPEEIRKRNLEQYGTDGARLFDAFCARCHTEGYSYGEPGVQGGGAFGPSLLNRRSVDQFPGVEDHIEFVTDGSEYEKGYGERGIGSGRMPGFGGMLTADQIKAIVEFERGL
jgi:mono/diheme cytochrome c family protein